MNATAVIAAFVSYPHPLFIQHLSSQQSYEKICTFIIHPILFFTKCLCPIPSVREERGWRFSYRGKYWFTNGVVQGWSLNEFLGLLIWIGGKIPIS